MLIASIMRPWPILALNPIPVGNDPCRLVGGDPIDIGADPSTRIV